MKNKTATQQKFEEELKKFEESITLCKVNIEDVLKIKELAFNLFLRYEEIRRSGDKWKEEYYELKNKG